MSKYVILVVTPDYIILKLINSSFSFFQYRLYIFLKL